MGLAYISTSASAAERSDTRAYSQNLFVTTAVSIPAFLTSKVVSEKNVLGRQKCIFLTNS